MNETPMPPRMRFTDSWAIRGGALLFVIGTGPLLAIVLAARLGLTSDPNPNPIGPGMLAGCTSLPSMVLLVTGVFQVIATNRRRPRR